MDIKTIAEKLNGCNYTEEVSEELHKLAKESGIVIVFGGGDDLMEFRGAIYDEVGCYEGGKAYITQDGLFESPSNCDECCKYLQNVMSKAKTIKAIWDVEGYWIYMTSIPHERFDVLEDGEKYCRGIVFNLADVGV